MLRSVILEGTAVRVYGARAVRDDSHLVSGVAAVDREVALRLVDSVVVLFGAILKSIRECVRARARYGLRTGELIFSSIAAYPSTFYYWRVAILKGLAIIILGKCL